MNPELLKILQDEYELAINDKEALQLLQEDGSPNSVNKASADKPIGAGRGVADIPASNVAAQDDDNDAAPAKKP